MKIVARISVVVISVLAGIAIGWFLNAARNRDQGGVKTLANSICSGHKDVTITVYADGLHNSDDQIFVCHGDTVLWQADKTTDANGNRLVKDFTVHFEETPFDKSFGKADYSAGEDYPQNLTDTGKKTAYAKVNIPGSIRCHKYSLTVIPHQGNPVVLDPHVIVSGTG